MRAMDGPLWILYRTLATLALGVHAYVQGYFLVMISEGQKYDMTEGETLNLICDFQADNYNLFDYPVLWKKTQHHEEHQINIMGNLNQPFESTKRFSVSYTKSPPTHRLELGINNVLPEDSGNYTCEVRGPQSKVITSVMHHVYVRAPVRTLRMMVGNYSAGQGSQADEPSRHSRHTTMIEGTLNTLKCVAYGGYPAPALKIKLGKDDITYQFHQATRPMLTGEPGLRIITYTTEVWTDTFNPSAHDDEARIKCVASISGLRANNTAIKLEVHYSPKITCEDLEVEAWERNPVLSCSIRAKPTITALSWIIDGNGTTVERGEHLHDFSIIIPEETDTYTEVQLLINQARPENFHEYTLMAENSIGAETAVARLTEIYPEPTSKNPPHVDQSQTRKRVYDAFVPFHNSAPSSIISKYGYIRHVVWIYSVWTLARTILLCSR